MRRYFFILLMIGLLTGCARSPAIKQYFFNCKPEHPPHSAIQTSQILMISNPVAAVSFQTKDMQYVQQPYQLSQFARHAWAAPPAEMLKPLLVETLQNTGRFHAVVSAPYTGLVDLRLDTKLLALYQEFQGNRSQVVLELQADLVEVNCNHLLRTRQFCVRVDSAQNTPYGGVVAANKAVSEMLTQIAFFVLDETYHRSYKVNLYQLPKPRGV